MEITVKIKNVYGKELIYPVCETSKSLASLTGRKTISPEALESIKSLGYEVKVQPETI